MAYGIASSGCREDDLLITPQTSLAVSLPCRGICKYRYEDGDNEHIQWAELKELLISLPGKDEAEGASTPAVVTKPKRNAGKTGEHHVHFQIGSEHMQPLHFGSSAYSPRGHAGGAGEESAKKQKLSPADEQPAKTPQEGLATDGKSCIMPIDRWTQLLLGDCTC